MSQVYFHRLFSGERLGLRDGVARSNSGGSVDGLQGGFVPHIPSPSGQEDYLFSYRRDVDVKNLVAVIDLKKIGMPRIFPSLGPGLQQVAQPLDLLRRVISQVFNVQIVLSMFRHIPF
jgi:hypothetical protein